MDENMEKARDHCIRCGECCLKSSPTLQVQDLPIIVKGIIEKTNLYTIRKGELVRDNIHDFLMVSRKEMIKVKERGEERKGCIYYDEEGKACKIYDQRPAQCAALKCWDTRDLVRVHSRPKLTREDIVEDKGLLEIIEEHEKRCNHFSLEKYVKQIESEGEKAVEKILDLLRFDSHVRQFISEKLGLNPHEVDFFFGRSLVESISRFGLQVIKQPDGTFFLTTIK